MLHPIGTNIELNRLQGDKRTASDTDALMCAFRTDGSDRRLGEENTKETMGCKQLSTPTVWMGHLRSFEAIVPN